MNIQCWYCWHFSTKVHGQVDIGGGVPVGPVQAVQAKLTAMLAKVKQNKTEHSFVEVKYHERGTVWKNPKNEDDVAELIETFSDRLQTGSEGGQPRGVPIQVSTLWIMIKEQNTLLKALWACTRVTKSPGVVGPRAFGHVRASQQSLKQSVLLLF